jgi:phosphonate transport system substrate-binding protein
MQSDPFAIPPVVASKVLSSELGERIAQLLFAMHQDPNGRRILRELLIDRFVAPQEEWYDAIRLMEQQRSVPEKGDHAAAKP